MPNIISPFSDEYVTRSEFHDFASHIDKRFAEQKEYMDGGFEKVFRKTYMVEINLVNKINSLAKEVIWIRKIVIKMGKKMEVI